MGFVQIRNQIDKMKIVITTHTYYPNKDGVQAVNKYLAEGLVKRGHEVTLITQSDNNFKSEEIINEVKIIRLPIYNIHTIYKGDKKSYQNMLVRMSENSNVIINVAAETPWTDWTFEILGEIKCIKVLYLHGMYDFSWHKEDFVSFSSIGHKIWNLLRWRFHYAAIGKYIKEYDVITQLHEDNDANIFYEKKYNVSGYVMENAADDNFFTPFDYHVKIDVPNNYFIFVGNYIERKNQEYVMRAFYQSNINKDIALIFIGSLKTSYYEKIVGLKKKYDAIFGERDIRFLESIPREHISEYVKRADLYLMGSKWEAYPVAIVESMAAGVPYIATDVGCVKYLPGGVIIHSEYEMKRWIEIMVENKNVSVSLGNAGKSYALTHLKVDACIDNFNNIICNKINEKKDSIK